VYQILLESRREFAT